MMTCPSIPTTKHETLTSTIHSVRVMRSLRHSGNLSQEGLAAGRRRPETGTAPLGHCALYFSCSRQRLGFRYSCLTGLCMFACAPPPGEPHPAHESATLASPPP